MPITALPSDALSLVLAQLCLVRDIKRAKRTCRAFRDAAAEAERKHRLVCFEGHKNEVLSVATSPDCRIITASRDMTINVWRDGACERTSQSHEHIVRAVAVLRGGARFVSGSPDGTVKLWSLDGVLERTFAVRSEALCVAALPDGVHFVVGLGVGNGGELRLYHVDGTLVHAFTAHTPRKPAHKGHAVRAVAVTPDGQHIISGSNDMSIKVWSVASKSLVSDCTGHTSAVHAVAAMPDGQRILSGGDDSVRVWLCGTIEITFWLHRYRVNALVALPDNQHALSGSDDRTVKLFNVNDGAIRRTFKHHTDWVRSLALLPDGLRFVSGSSDGTARIAEHGFAFEPDPAWVEAEAKREAERRAYAYLARLTGQQYGANKPPPAAPAPAAPAPAASSALDAFFDEDEHVPPAATPDAPADAPAPDSPSEEEQMAQAISNSLNDPTSMRRRQRCWRRWWWRWWLRRAQSRRKIVDD